MRKDELINRNHRDFLFIDSDCLFITDRLKEVDQSYRVVFSLKKKKFEVHSILQSSTYCFTLPYSSLDERAVDYAKKTRSENAEKLIKEIDRANEELYRKMLKEEINKLKEALC